MNGFIATHFGGADIQQSDTMFSRQKHEFHYGDGVVAHVMVHPSHPLYSWCLPSPVAAGWVRWVSLVRDSFNSALEAVRYASSSSWSRSLELSSCPSLCKVVWILLGVEGEVVGNRVPFLRAETETFVEN